MTRVTYGVASSSYHAIRSLAECANFEGVPQETQKAIKRDFYVDDILTGADSVDEAKALQSSLIEVLKEAKFDLRKWTCSDASLILDLPPEYREANENLEFLDKDHTIKTLGIVWNPTQDVFLFKVAHVENDSFDKQNTTKRQMLSDISKIFDPLGWLSPATIQLKQLMQRSWESSTNWDEKLPDHLIIAYLEWRSKLTSLKEMKLERFILVEGLADNLDVHLFCDASEKAYAACIYVVASTRNGNVRSSLLVAKTKVAPLKSQSIPRLELCAALLGVRLLKSTLKAIGQLNLVIGRQYAWTDSTIVLSWLSREPSYWSTFVSNRVSEIQSQPLVKWNHVRSENNPADPASRGVDFDTLKFNSLWWSGPEWLVTGNFPQPFCPEEVCEERKKTKITTLHVNASASIDDDTDILDLSRYNSLYKALRILAYLRRFILKLKKDLKVFPTYITASELGDSMMTLLRQEQRKVYSQEIQTLEVAPQVKKDSKILKLYPFLYNGVLCVGGRLAHANLPDESKYQRLIPQNSHLARLVVANSHQSTLHGGTTQVMAHIRTRFWIPSCRSLVRKLILNCVGCNRFNVKPQYPLMGDLPKERVDPPLKAFQDVGIDFAGPFLSRKSSRTVVKSYMALFICFASKAVHLEAVSDMTTSACSAALRRFVARRGCPKTIYSDNGRNFIGTRAEIMELQRILKAEHEDSLQTLAAGLLINWVFIPPRAPHFGGLWESAIKRAKQHLRKVMGNKVLTFEELGTLFCQIELILNSRPICPISEDPNDDTILTPAHLCLGGKLDCLPLKETAGCNRSTEEEASDSTAVRKWAHLQNLTIHFWRRWTKEYVTSLQERNKWKRETSGLKVGDVVYVTDDNTPPLQWPLARVSYVYSGPDGFVRVVKIKTANGTYNRPVHKLRKLFDVTQQNDN